MDTLIQNNAKDLKNELDWLAQLINKRFEDYFNGVALTASVLFEAVQAPQLKKGGSSYADFVVANKLGLPERVTLILALAPHLKPEMLDIFLTKNAHFDKRFTEFGGVSDGISGIIPTAETLFFVLGGSDLAERFACYPLIAAESLLFRSGVLKLEPQNRNEPSLRGKLLLTEGQADFFISGSFGRPEFGEQFPARLITTDLDWESVVLHPRVYEDVMEISHWIRYSRDVMETNGLAKRLKPGYKSLFYGPPGTGKTMTATLIGKSTGHDVYRIDLSLVVSKYIGETEKNLSKIFDLAAQKNWILFFDEADALFGKRTSASSSNDRYANQEVAYLLQRLEDHPGVVILASNLKENIDTAFMRRFQTVIHFPMPGPDERYAIWKQAFSKKLPPAKSVDLRGIAEKYELSGGLMMNVIRYCTLKALRDQKKSIPQEDIEAGIRRELLKDGIWLS